jgi:hypothetical protein
MTNKLYINNQDFLDINVDVAKAKAVFSELNTNALPVVEEKAFKGMLFLSAIEDFDNSKPLRLLTHLFQDISLKNGYTFFDWFKMCSTYDVTQIPLVNPKGFHFEGNVGLKEILEIYKNSSLTLELSTILVVEKDSETFAYSQVFQIVEAHGAKVLATFIGNSNKETTEVVLKILHTGLNELLQSFRRYDYDIISYHDEDLHHETLKDNSEYLSKYLTV